ncbi:MAG: DMT family transporter [Nitriliruptor sp.]|uniref:DMT family transporter n=1 Tax=Nitriliruptor sp. TaxID=2448056 RepID=UPI00349FF9A8
MTRAAGSGRGPLDIAAAAVLWGTAGATQELLLPTAAPVAVAAYRCLLGGGVLLAWVLRAPRRDSLVATVRGGGWPLTTAPLAMTVFQATYLLGIRTAGVAIGTLVALGSAPAWAGFLALLSGRRPGGRWLVATLVAVAGLAALVGADASGVTVGGVALAATAGAAYALYATASARLTVPDRVSVVAVVFTTCGLLLLPAALGSVGVGTTVEEVGGLLWLAVGTTVVAYVLFLRGLVRVDAPTATTLSLLEPLTAAALAFTLVGERTTWVGAAGVVALSAGVVIAGRSGPARAPVR